MENLTSDYFVWVSGEFIAIHGSAVKKFCLAMWADCLQI